MEGGCFLGGYDFWRILEEICYLRVNINSICTKALYLNYYSQVDLTAPIGC